MQHVIKLTNMDKTFEESCEGRGGGGSQQLVSGWCWYVLLLSV